MSDLQCPARIIVAGAWVGSVRWPDTLRIADVFAEPSLNESAAVAAGQLGINGVRALPTGCSLDEAIDTVVDSYRGEAVLVVLATNDGTETAPPEQALMLHVDNDGRRAEQVPLERLPR